MGYALLCVGQIIGMLCLSIWNAMASIRAGRTLHQDCMARIMRAPMSWYEREREGGG